MSVHFSSKKEDWETPQELFDLLNGEFNFTADVCATAENAKCNVYITPEMNGLEYGWENDVCWMNPPYGREIRQWMAKAYEAAKLGGTVVCLVPARTDTNWWWDYCTRATEIRFLKGRIRFSGHKNSAPFPSAIVVFSGGEVMTLKTLYASIYVWWWDWKSDLENAL